MARRVSDTVAAPPPKPQQLHRQGSKLPRELVAWLQSMGAVGTAVNNPKRDLSNGYLIGELCAAYWTDVPRHALQNELSTVRKQANWRVLAKLFARHGAPLSDAMIDGMIAARDPQYAEVFLLQLYSLLTGRALRTPAPTNALALPPVVVPDAPYRPPQVLASVAATGGGVESGGEDGWGLSGVSLPTGLLGGPTEAAGALAGVVGRQGGASPMLPALHSREPPPLPLSSTMNSPSAGGEAALARSGVKGSHGSTDAAGDDVDENGRVRVKFHVAVRAAKQATTVVSAGVTPVRGGTAAKATASSSSSAAAAGDGVDGGDAQDGGVAASPTAAGSSVTDITTTTVDLSLSPEVGMWLATVMNKATGVRGDGRADTADHHPQSIHHASRQILRFFACVEQNPTCGHAVWSTLHAQCERLASHVRADGGVLEQLVEVLLRVPMALAQDVRVHVPTEGWPVLCALVARLAALHPYQAVTCVNWGLLGNTSLMRRCVALAEVPGVADGLAAVMLASVQSLVPSAALARLAELLAALTDALLHSSAHPAEPAGVLRLLVHRALLCQVAEAAWEGEGGALPNTTTTAAAAAAVTSTSGGHTHPSTRGSPPPATHARPTMRGGLSVVAASPGWGGDGGTVLEWLQESCAALATEALEETQPDPAVPTTGCAPLRLAAAWLAVAVLQSANMSDASRAATVAEALFPYLGTPLDVTAADPAATAWALVQVRWLRAAAATLTAGAASDGLAAQVMERITEGCQALTDTPLMAAGGEESAAVAAMVCELAYLLGDVPASNALPPNVATRIADTVVALTLHCPDDILDRVFPPVSATGGGTLWTAPVLGAVTLAVDVAQQSSPLLLTEALARRYPPSRSSGPSDSTAAAARREFPPTTGPAAAALRRRVVAAGAALVRDGAALEAVTEDRLRLLYYFNRCSGGRGMGAGPTASDRAARDGMLGSAGVGDGRSRWHAMHMAFYEDLTLVTAAAEALMARRQQQQQRGGGRRGEAAASAAETSTTAAQAQLLALAAMAQRVVLVWAAQHADGLHAGGERRGGGGRATSVMSSATAVGSAAGVSVPAEGAETTEQLTAAMEWLQGTIVPAA